LTADLSELGNKCRRKNCRQHPSPKYGKFEKMPKPSQKRVIFLLGCLMMILHFISSSSSILTQLALRKSLLVRKRRILKRRRDINVASVIATTVALQEHQYGFRRFWVGTRSTHWILHMLEGTILAGEQFEKFFRMDRNSFEGLHAILGMYRFVL
jgi:hypothetical protein